MCAMCVKTQSILKLSCVQVTWTVQMTTKAIDAPTAQPPRRSRVPLTQTSRTSRGQTSCRDRNRSTTTTDDLEGALGNLDLNQKLSYNYSN